jgi:prepilin peptidase CpaA
MSLQQSLLGVVVLVTAAAAVTDARSGRIPNALTLPLVGLAPLARGLFLGSGGLFWSLVGAGVTVALPLVLFLRRAMGGGDVKLLCGIGGALGAIRGLEVQLGAYVFAAAFGIAALARKRRLASTIGRVFRRSQASAGAEPPAEPETVRLGIPIFLSTLLCVAQGGLGG